MYKNPSINTFIDKIHVHVVWQLTKVKAESVSLQQFERQVLQCLSTAGYMVDAWAARMHRVPLCCSTACWFKWKAMHYEWRRKCTLTHWSRGAWPLFLAGGERKKWSAMVCHRGNLTPHLPACDTFSLQSPLFFTTQMGYGFFFPCWLDCVRLLHVYRSMRVRH